MATPDYLTAGNCEARIGAAAVTRLTDDDGDGVRDTVVLNDILAEAEGLAASYMLRAFTKQQISTLAANDPNFVAQVAWVACELMSERRGEFLAGDGKGRYWSQYERAVSYFDRLAKATLKSLGEAAAGTNPHSGGTVRPRTTSGQLPQFIFTPDSRNPRGQGGY